MITSKVRLRGCGREGAIAEELREIRERIAMMERWGIHPKEMSDEEESTEEAEPQGEVDPV